MDEQRLTALATEAIADSKRTDCEVVGVKAEAEGAWRVELMDVMLKGEPFSVRIATDGSQSEQELKEALRRAIAEHYSMESY